MKNKAIQEQFGVFLFDAPVLQVRSRYDEPPHEKLRLLQKTEVEAMIELEEIHRKEKYGNKSNPR